jgi:hypothetical protein
MAVTKNKKTKVKSKKKKVENRLPISTRRLALQAMLNSTGTQARDALVRGRINRDIDMNYECRWPTEIKPQDYADLFVRNSVAGRVVTLWPSECWIQLPNIYEDESAETETTVEKEWKALEERVKVLNYVKRVDVLSGIGRYGVLFLGFDDLGMNEKFTKPVEGVEENAGEEISKPKKRELLYMRAYQETQAMITEWDKDKGSPRYGLPIMYELKMDSPGGTGITTEKVHWTRILHVTDNLMSSEIYGEPRMKPVWNDLIDLRKLKGGASEGYWRACLSGTAWTLDKDLVDAMTEVSSDDKDDIRDQIEDYYNSLQRDLFVEGYVPKDISPKLVDPKPFAEVLLKLICVRLEVPYNIFIGDEGRLEGRQQRSAWLERVRGRQLNHITPNILMPLLSYLQKVGVLTATEEALKVEWPERDSPSEADIATIAESTTRAMAAYVSGGVNQLIGEREYLSQVFKKDADQIDAIADDVEDWERENEVSEADVLPPDDNKKKKDDKNDKD